MGLGRNLILLYGGYVCMVPNFETHSIFCEDVGKITQRFNGWIP